MEVKILDIKKKWKIYIIFICKIGSGEGRKWLRIDIKMAI